MKTMKCLYNNYDIDDKEWFEAYKEFCEMNELNVPDDDDEYSSEFYVWQSEQLNNDWEDLMIRIETDIENNVNCVVTGSIGRWNGTFDIQPKAFATLKLAIDACVSNCDYIIVSEINGVINIEAIHHDGSNIFKIYKLNNKGLDAYNNDEILDKEEYYEKFDI